MVKDLFKKCNIFKLQVSYKRITPALDTLYSKNCFYQSVFNNKRNKIKNIQARRFITASHKWITQPSIDSLSESTKPNLSEVIQNIAYRLGQFQFVNVRPPELCNGLFAGGQNSRPYTVNLIEGRNCGFEATLTSIYDRLIGQDLPTRSFNVLTVRHLIKGACSLEDCTFEAADWVHLFLTVTCSMVVKDMPFVCWNFKFY